MSDQTKALLISAWNYCDREDKSTEFMFVYMADVAGVEYDTAVDFVMGYERTEEDMKL